MPGAARRCGDAAPEAVVGLHAADGIAGGKGCPAGGCGRVLLHGVPAVVGAGFFAQPQNRGAPLQRQSAQGVQHRARPATEFSVLHGGCLLLYKISMGWGTGGGAGRRGRRPLQCYCRGEHCSPVPVCCVRNLSRKACCCGAAVRWRATNGRPYTRNGLKSFPQNSIQAQYNISKPCRQCSFCAVGGERCAFIVYGGKTTAFY